MPYIDPMGQNVNSKSDANWQAGSLAANRYPIMTKGNFVFDTLVLLSFFPTTGQQIYLKVFEHTGTRKEQHILLAFNSTSTL